MKTAIDFFLLLFFLSFISFLQRWWYFFQARVHLKDLLSSFPPGPPIRDTEEQLDYLVGKDRQNISMATIRYVSSVRSPQS